MLVALAAPAAGVKAQARPQGLSTALSDREFWRLVNELSEASGYFRSDNFLSNEATFQEVIPRLKQSVAAGGVYLGVGPEQNFTYIVALEPRMAFIIDIRRQNMLEHLLYKALIELSRDRAEFLSHLFARPRPAGLDARTSSDTLLQAYDAVKPDSASFRRSLAAVKALLVKRHGFALTSEDLDKIDYVYTAFFAAGPGLTYSFAVGGQGYGFRRMPTYTELMTATDGQGVNRSYLATEDNFRTLKRLERDNLIIPLVGDFAGPKAVRAVGRYLQEHGATVTAFYTSNVEQYLFQQGGEWEQFYGNVATLPIDAASTFIRWVSRRTTPGPSRVTVLCSIAELLTAFSGGEIHSYDDVIQLSK